MSPNPTKKPEAMVEPRVLNVRINPELRASLKAAAALDQVTIEEKVHAIFCHELDRMDLYHQGPDSFAC